MSTQQSPSASICVCVLSRCQPQVNGHATILVHVTSAIAKHGMAIFDSVCDGAGFVLVGNLFEVNNQHGQQMLDSQC